MWIWWTSCSFLCRSKELFLIPFIEEYFSHVFRLRKVRAGPVGKAVKSAKCSKYQKKIDLIRNWNTFWVSEKSTAWQPRDVNQIIKMSDAYLLEYWQNKPETRSHRIQKSYQVMRKQVDLYYDPNQDHCLNWLFSHILWLSSNQCFKSENGYPGQFTFSEAQQVFYRLSEWSNLDFQQAQVETTDQCTRTIAMDEKNLNSLNLKHLFATI